MIHYEGRVFRPPSEAYSLIVQVTIGCSHNKCTFCDMYKEKQFRVRKLEDVKRDFDEARRAYRQVDRISWQTVTRSCVDPSTWPRFCAISASFSRSASA